MLRRAALALLLVLLATLVAGCGGTNEEALDASRERAEEQHGGEEGADADQGESQVEGDQGANDEESDEGEEVEASSDDEDTGVEEQQDAAAEGGDGAAGGAVDVEAARELFSASCAGCHTLTDAEASGTVGPNLDETSMDAEAITQQILNGGGAMPGGLLQGEDAETVAAYVAQVAGS